VLAGDVSCVGDVAESTVRRQVGHCERVLANNQHSTHDQRADRHDGDGHQQAVGGRVSSKSADRPSESAVQLVGHHHRARRRHDDDDAAAAVTRTMTSDERTPRDRSLWQLSSRRASVVKK